MKQKQTGRVNLPELENPINSNVENDSFSGEQPCMFLFLREGSSNSN